MKVAKWHLQMSQSLIGYRHIISRSTVDYCTYLFVCLSETFRLDFRTQFHTAPRYSETQHHHQMPETKTFGNFIYTLWLCSRMSYLFKSYVPARTCSHNAAICYVCRIATPPNLRRNRGTTMLQSTFPAIGECKAHAYKPILCLLFVFRQFTVARMIRVWYYTF
jgi:hypothetical protein